MKYHIFLSYIYFILFFSSCSSQIEKISPKTFFENSISKKRYSIYEFEKMLKKSENEHFLLINKGIRFKTFFKAQKYSVTAYSEKCKLNSSEIKLIDLKINNTFKKGIVNSNILFDIAKKYDKNLEIEYLEKFNSLIDRFKDIHKFESENCNSMLNELKLRNIGEFYDNKNGNNILAFNYILNPVEELFSGFHQEFFSVVNSDNEYSISLKLPKSWSKKEKKDFSSKTTIGHYTPNEKFLNSSITISTQSLPFITKKEMQTENISDNDIIDIIYEETDDVILSIFKIFHPKLLKKSNLKITKYNNGVKNIILYSSMADLGDITNNDFLKGNRVKHLSAITIKNGTLINIDCNGIITTDFNGYDYYSKLFFKVINSLKINKIDNNKILLTEMNNMKFVKVSINDFEYQFLLDTGASNIVINQKILTEMIKTNFISNENYLGVNYATIADGSLIICENWLLPKIKVGHRIVKNVIVSVIDAENSTPLFGMSGLKKINYSSINLRENEIILKNTK